MGQGRDHRKSYMATPSETYKATIKAQINGDKSHGWGVKDSMAVIAALWAEETGDAFPEEIRKLVESVVNPSQFRQKLEAAGHLNPSAKKVDALLTDL
jgi:hypothetical protein